MHEELLRHLVSVQRRTRRRRLGRVADFCLICRGPAAFDLIAVTATERVELIFVVVEQIIGHEIRCERCASVYPTEAQRYSHHAQDHSDDTSALIAHTHPGFEKRYALELDRETRLVTGKLGWEERNALLLEPFLALRDAARGDAGLLPRVDRTTRLALAVTACIALSLFWREPIRTHVPEVYAGIKMAVVVGILASLLLAWSRSRRFVKASILPRLAIALQPLHPAFDELSAVLDYFRARGEPLGRWISVGDLHAAVCRPPRVRGTVAPVRPDQELVHLTWESIARR